MVGDVDEQYNVSSYMLTLSSYCLALKILFESEILHDHKSCIIYPFIFFGCFFIHIVAVEMGVKNM